jgi:hypothetical protein
VDEYIAADKFDFNEFLEVIQEHTVYLMFPHIKYRP